MLKWVHIAAMLCEFIAAMFIWVHIAAMHVKVGSYSSYVIICEFIAAML